MVESIDLQRVSLHRSQIFKKFMIDAGYSNRTRRLRRPILLQFSTEKLLNSVYRWLPVKNRLLNGREAAVQELSSPQSARRFGFSVIFAGQRDG